MFPNFRASTRIGSAKCTFNKSREGVRRIIRPLVHSPNSHVFITLRACEYRNLIENYLRSAPSLMS